MDFLRANFVLETALDAIQEGEIGEAIDAIRLFEYGEDDEPGTPSPAVRGKTPAIKKIPGRMGSADQNKVKAAFGKFKPTTPVRSTSPANPATRGAAPTIKKTGPGLVDKVKAAGKWKPTQTVRQQTSSVAAKPWRTRIEEAVAKPSAADKLRKR